MNKKMRYYYGMKYRGFSPGAQPKKGLIGCIENNETEYYDVIEYDRKLTDEEISNYELEEINVKE